MSYSHRAIQAGYRINQIRIHHPAFKEALDGVGRVIQLGNNFEHPVGTCVIAPSGAGKSFLIESVQRNVCNWPFLRPESVLVASLKEAPTVAQIQEDLLADFNYAIPPRTGRKTNAALFNVLVASIEQHDIQLIAIDEYQHVFLSRKDEVRVAINDWIKRLMTKTVIDEQSTGCPLPANRTRQNLRENMMRAQIRSLHPVSSQEDVAGAINHLHSTAVGSYHRNHGLIRLTQDTSFWNPHNEPTLARLSVFVHEYLHFNHNFSTVVGLYDFVAQLRLLRAFCNTVDVNGRSLGSAVLTAEARAEVKNLLTWRSHLRGGAVPHVRSSLRRARVHPSFAGVKHYAFTTKLAAQELECDGVIAMLDGAAVGMGDTPLEVSLGSEILMEGCAVEAECILFERSGVPAEMVRDSVPAYPYLTARTVFEGIAGVSPSSKFMCSVCVLALQSTNPGEAFVQIAMACKRPGGAFNEEDEESALDQFKASSGVFFRASIKRIIADLLPLEIAPFRERGRAGRGLVRMIEWCNVLLQQRIQDELFECTALDKAPDLEPLVEILRTMPVCPVIQEVDALGQMDELIFFSDQEVPVDFVTEIAAAQSLLHFSDSHLTTDGSILPTPDAPARDGLFVNACQAPLAISKSQTCRRAPWESFNADEPLGCWYAQGVVAARGRPNIE